MEISEEDKEPGDEYRCALILECLYRTRDAFLQWAECYTRLFLKLGFSSAIKVMVHGDDFVSERAAVDLACLDTKLEKEFIMKTRFLGQMQEKWAS